MNIGIECSYPLKTTVSNSQPNASSRPNKLKSKLKKFSKNASKSLSSNPLLIKNHSFSNLSTTNDNDSKFRLRSNSLPNFSKTIYQKKTPSNIPSFRSSIGSNINELYFAYSNTSQESVEVIDQDRYHEYLILNNSCKCCHCNYVDNELQMTHPISGTRHMSRFSSSSNSSIRSNDEEEEVPSEDDQIDRIANNILKVISVSGKEFKWDI